MSYPLSDIFRMLNFTVCFKWWIWLSSDIILYSVASLVCLGSLRNVVMILVVFFSESRIQTFYRKLVALYILFKQSATCWRRNTHAYQVALASYLLFRHPTSFHDWVTCLARVVYALLFGFDGLLRHDSRYMKCWSNGQNT